MASVDVTPCADAEHNPALLAQELAEETMHKRIKELVSLIHKGYSQEEIAKTLKVTSRTLRNDLKVLKKALQGRIDAYQADQVYEAPQVKVTIPQYKGTWEKLPVNVWRVKQAKSRWTVRYTVGKPVCTYQVQQGFDPLTNIGKRIAVKQ